MIELKNINKSINNKPIIKNFNLKVSNGEFIALLGESGCGKTTLLNIMALLDYPDNGEVIFNNKKLNKKNKIDYFKNDLGYLFQDYGLVESKTVYQNFSYYLSDLKMKKLTPRKLDLALKAFGLKVVHSQRVYELSGGEQQRVALLRVLLKEPKIILADEPTGNLDSNNEKIIFKELQSIAKKGNIVIVVSHSKTICEYASRVIKL